MNIETYEVPLIMNEGVSKVKDKWLYLIWNEIFAVTEKDIIPS